MIREGLLEEVGPELGPKEGGALPKRRPLEVGERQWASSVVSRRGREVNDWKGRLRPHGEGLQATTQGICQ